MSFTREVLTAHIECLEDALNRTRRALWLARAERAYSEAKFNNQMARRYEEHKEHTISKSYDAEVHKWVKAERKCRAYADKFKEE